MQALIFAASLLLAANYGGSSQRIHGAISTVPNASVTFPLVAPAGSAVAPSIAVGNPNTGLFQDPNGWVALTDNGNVVFLCNPNQCTVIPASLVFQALNGNTLNANNVVVKNVVNVGSGSSGSVIVGSGGSGLKLAMNGSHAAVTADTGGGVVYDAYAFKANGPVGVSPYTMSNGFIDSYATAVPTIIDPANTYFYDECSTWFPPSSSLSYATGGASGTNFGSVAAGLTSAANDANHPSTYWVATSTSTSSAFVSGKNPVLIIKSSTLTYQWRYLFSFPSILSTAANRYVFYVGGFSVNGTAPYTGPYIEYSDNVNSGNWVLGSGARGTLTTTNTATAVPAVSTWHQLTITLVNGVYTYVLDGTTLGTVTDSNLPTSVTATTYTAVDGTIYLQSNTAFTSVVYAVADRFDALITGQNR